MLDEVAHIAAKAASEEAYHLRLDGMLRDEIALAVCEEEARRWAREVYEDNYRGLTNIVGNHRY